MRKEIDRIFVAYKPSGIGSNNFLSQLKRKYNVKKAGFSGTLDPFAKGVLVVAFGRFTRLFSHLKKTPKVYKATLWLGTKSDTLDIEQGVTHIDTPIFTQEAVKEALFSFIGELTYVPPIFSAKKIEGKRAYDLAREGKKVPLQDVTSTIYDIKFLHYCHPFITFEASVSEGTYIRSLGNLVAKKLKSDGVLCMLERINEGILFYDNEKELLPINIVDAQDNTYDGEDQDIDFGRKLDINRLKFTQNGKYILRTKDNFAIIAIENNEVNYLLNKVPLC